MFTSPMLLEVQSRARNVLKALNGAEVKDEDKKKETPAAVPDPPAADDRKDPRVGDASPTKEDLDAAKDKGGDGAGDDPDGLGADGGDDAGTGADAGDGAGADAGRDEGFNEFGHRDMDPREVKKAFPKIGHLFPDEALVEIEDNETPNGADPKVLDELVAAFKGMSDVLGGIKAELERLQKGSEAQGRELKKALDANQDLAAQVAALKDPRTAPAAADGPRAVEKALGSVQEQAGFTTPELNLLAASGKVSSHEIAMLCATQGR